MAFPHIAEWVQDHGWIEIGQDEAFQDLEAGLTEWMEQNF